MKDEKKRSKVNAMPVSVPTTTGEAESVDIHLRGRVMLTWVAGDAQGLRAREAVVVPTIRTSVKRAHGRGQSAPLVQAFDVHILRRRRC